MLMKPTLLRTILYVAFWFVVFLYFVMMRNLGAEAVPGGQGRAQLPLHSMVVLALAGGLITGVLYSIVDRLFRIPRFERQPYGLIILVRGTAQLAITVLAGLSIIFVGTVVLQVSELSMADRIQAMLASHSAVLLVLTSFLASFGLNFFQIMQGKIGTQVLINLLWGRYHSPREEERIFMFLDLRSSTTYAERLGNIRYSRLIQDCFSDVTGAIKRHRAEIYQYVGDEVVLTWPCATGGADLNWLGAYADFMQALQERAPYYASTYGFVPEFKAGVNCGIVTVAEVGVVKREIAYHGDVLNTAARIQAKCNEYGRALLVAEAIAVRLPPDPKLIVELVGDLALRGKEHTVKIYSVGLPLESARLGPKPLEGSFERGPSSSRSSATASYPPDDA
jgi:adenylate cyclase